jgi:hypothetical protein
VHFIEKLLILFKKFFFQIPARIRKKVSDPTGSGTTTLFAANGIHIFDPSIQILYMLNRSSPPVLPDLWFRGGGREAQTEDGLL